MAEVLANVTRLPMPGMVLIRARDQVAQAAAAALAMDLPATGRFVSDDQRRLLWMSPDEMLLICPLSDTPQAVASLNDALAGQFALVADVSDMRALFAVEGGRATQALAKLMPVDFEALPDDGVRRTRAGQVACAVWRETPDDARGQNLRLICFRSVAGYMAEALSGAARHGAALDPR
ncbi:sarcosine oxidase subunit gamma [Paracoccus jiaweipingae]|uniref:sarcosine oxidase subunit gamma n=1 Tax=unclassified Paracoccus (in: a-proteobacteria) TaxID=2688777 RepID=UPI0037A411A1